MMIDIESEFSPTIKNTQLLTTALLQMPHILIHSGTVDGTPAATC